MSDATKHMLWVFSLAGTAILFGLCGTHGGRLQGRAEMKRWQDQWYSKPIVEHQTVFQDHFYREDGSIEECESHTLPNSFAISKMDCQQVTPPPPSKARKPRSKGWEGGPTGTITLPADGFELEGRGPCAVTAEGVTRPCTIKELAQPKVKPIGCEGIFLEGYGDQIHWAKF